MTLDELEIFRLAQVPIDGPGRLFLYPEFGGDEALISGIEEWIAGDATEVPIGKKSSRKVVMVLNGYNSFVVKPQRPLEHEYFHDLDSRSAWHTDLSLKEISVARYLREFARYHDDCLSIDYELPLGIYKTPDSRYTLFMYIQNLENPDLLQSGQALKENWDDISIYINEGYSKWGLPAEPIEQNWRIQKQIDELFFPEAFAWIVLLSNGIYHNEMRQTSPDCSELHFQFEGDHKKIIFTDFELCRIASLAENVAYASVIDYEIWKLVQIDPWTPSRQAEEVLGTRIPVISRPFSSEGRKNMLNALRELYNPILALSKGFGLLADRIESVLGPTGYFEGDFRFPLHLAYLKEALHTDISEY